VDFTSSWQKSGPQVVRCAAALPKQGGFRAWAAAGLGVRDAADYAVSPVEALGERVGLLAGATGASLCALLCASQADLAPCSCMLLVGLCHSAVRSPG
jgi:hypothetical protein